MSRSPQAGIEELKAELAELEGPARQAMAARIKVAREEGDLKENAEYHVAKEDQAHMETRIKRLQERLRNAVVVEVSDIDSDVFTFGRTRRGARRVQRRDRRLDPGRLDRGQPRRRPALGRVADRPGADGRQGRLDRDGRDAERQPRLQGPEARLLERRGC